MNKGYAEYIFESSRRYGDMDIKKMKDKALSEEQMENVAGGTYFDSMEVANFLQKAGYNDVLKNGVIVKFEEMRNAIDKLGFESHDHGGLLNSNTYKEKATGREFSQEEFMRYLKNKFPGVK